MADFARLACRRATLLPLKKGKKENKKRSLRKKMTVFLSSLLARRKFELYFERFKICRSEGNQRAFIVLFQRTDEKDNE